jgi:hypothetical protein
MTMADEESKQSGAPRHVSIHSRNSKVDVGRLASMPSGFSWYENLDKMIPRILAGDDLRRLVSRVARAVREGRPVIMMMGAHTVKCGLGGLIGDMIRRGCVTSVAMNGACAIHDVELALWGRTSEDVGEGLQTGGFGMTRETADFFARAARRCLTDDRGMGEALEIELGVARPSYGDISVVNACSAKAIPLTVHVALGTDVVHQHDAADGRAIGHGTMLDFRAFAARIAGLRGGVVLNIGSAVIMPEVFLKALAMARSRGQDLGDFTAANFDMYSMYRPRLNVVERPRLIGATTFSFLGHHEILLPVLFASILSEIER